MTKGTRTNEPTVRILAIETSCDETAAAVVENGRTILSNVVASQEKLHAQYGGIFPELASREHNLAIYPVIDRALRGAHLSIGEVDAIAVTNGPGLPGSLVVGINAAKGLALGGSLPLLAINHLEGHIYSAWLTPVGEANAPEPEFPLVALIVSGGHTELILMTGHLAYTRLGGTLDDAAGEAFDKVARLLNVGYPGGPAIQHAARMGNPNAFALPRAMLPRSWNFSFSGLKTAVLRETRAIEEKGVPLPVEDIAASFQNAVVDVLISKTLQAAEYYKARSILVVGGVSANQLLRGRIGVESRVPVHIPPMYLCTDNAAMIAAAAYRRFTNGQRDGLAFDALPNYPLTNRP